MTYLNDHAFSWLFNRSLATNLEIIPHGMINFAHFTVRILGVSDLWIIDEKELHEKIAEQTLKTINAIDPVLLMLPLNQEDVAVSRLSLFEDPKVVTKQQDAIRQTIMETIDKWKNNQL